MHEIEGENQQLISAMPEYQKFLNFKIKQKLLFSKATEKSSERKQQPYPGPRMHHSSIVYRNKIYIWGGSIENNISKSNLFALYVYELDNKRWKTFSNKIVSEQKDAILGQCHTVINNRWYLFGGVNQNDDYASQLWKLNLDSFEWVKCDQKNQIPPGSQGGCLAGLQKNWLLHYPSFNSKSTNNDNHFYIYSNDSKNWHCCEGNYQFILKSRIGASMCLQNGRVFMFGGASHQGQCIQYLNSFYELSVQTPTKYSKARVDIKIVRDNLHIQPRAEVNLFPVLKNYICLLGGRNDEQQFSDLWIYNIRTYEWTKDSSFNTPLLMRNGISCVVGGDQLFLFGGMVENNDDFSYCNDLWSIKMGWENLNSSAEDSQNTEITFNVNCCLCYQKRNKFMFFSKDFCSSLIKNIQDEIEFPFAAFGLLLDNCIINGANTISIQFQTDINNEYFIKIEDNAKNSWTDQEFIINITNFCSQNNSILLGSDKKIKKSIVRNNLAKQFGVNLKLGGFRLGKRILFISMEGDLMRVCSFYKSNFEDGPQKWKYIVYYYSYDLRNDCLADQEMQSSQQQIDHEYKKYIRNALNNRSNKNIVYIFETEINDDSQLNFCWQSNDLRFGDIKQVNKLQQMGYNISQSIDISFRAYLSALYIKNESMAITMGLRNKLELIHIQCSLDHIDKLCKAGISVELDSLVQFDFKFAQFYYLRDLKQQHHFFSNGILLYYRNRLISRYKIPFGEMIDFLMSKRSGFSNYLPLFGFAELPENIPLNASKTNFAFTVMLQKMQSRLKFIDKSFEKRVPYFLKMNQLPHPRTRIMNFQDFAHKSKRSIVEVSNEREMESRKRYSQKGSEEPLIKKKSKRKLESALDFVPPIYQLRQIEKQLKKGKEVQQQSKNKQCVLIQHIEQSQVQQISHPQHKKS